MRIFRKKNIGKSKAEIAAEAESNARRLPEIGPRPRLTESALSSGIHAPVGPLGAIAYCRNQNRYTGALRVSRPPRLPFAPALQSRIHPIPEGMFLRGRPVVLPSIKPSLGRPDPGELEVSAVASAADRFKDVTSRSICDRYTLNLASITHSRNYKLPSITQPLQARNFSPPVPKYIPFPTQSSVLPPIKEDKVDEDEDYEEEEEGQEEELATSEIIESNSCPEGDDESDEEYEYIVKETAFSRAVMKVKKSQLRRGGTSDSKKDDDTIDGTELIPKYAVTSARPYSSLVRNKKVVNRRKHRHCSKSPSLPTIPEDEVVNHVSARPLRAMSYLFLKEQKMIEEEMIKEHEVEEDEVEEDEVEEDQCEEESLTHIASDGDKSFDKDDKINGEDGTLTENDDTFEDDPENNEEEYKTSDVESEEEESTLTKEESTLSKEESTLSKEESTLSKEESTLSKEESTLSKEESTLTKEESTLSKEEDEDSLSEDYESSFEKESNEDEEANKVDAQSAESNDKQDDQLKNDTEAEIGANAQMDDDTATIIRKETDPKEDDSHFQLFVSCNKSAETKIEKHEHLEVNSVHSVDSDFEFDNIHEKSDANENSVNGVTEVQHHQMIIENDEEDKGSADIEKKESDCNVDGKEKSNQETVENDVTSKDDNPIEKDDGIVEMEEYISAETCTYGKTEESEKKENDNENAEGDINEGNIKNIKASAKENEDNESDKYEVVILSDETMPHKEGTPDANEDNEDKVVTPNGEDILLSDEKEVLEPEKEDEAREVVLENKEANASEDVNTDIILNDLTEEKSSLEIEDLEDLEVIDISHADYHEIEIKACTKNILPNRRRRKVSLKPLKRLLSKIKKKVRSLFN